jgi:hypothetical protein
MKNQLFGISSLIALSVPAALFTLAPNAQAINVMQGSTATTTLTPVPDSAVSNLTNQSVLSANYTSGVTDFDSYVATTTAAAPGVSDNSSLFAFSGTSGVITFDLGASYTLNALALWPTVGGSTSMRNFNLYADTDANTNNLGTLLGGFSASAGSSYPVAAQVFNFGATNTRFVQMAITSNGGGAITGLDEIAFSAQPVPWETDALSVIGTTLLFAGGVWAKRKSAKPLDKE